LLFAAATRVSHAEPKSHWNQWDDDGLDGVVQGTTKLGLGADYGFAGSDHTVRLAVEAEHLLRNRWGVAFGAGLPLGGLWVAPATLGLRLHALPKLPIDPFATISGGVAWLRLPGLPDTAAPLVAAHAGVDVFYFGLFFAQIDAGYDFVRYGRAGVTRDLAGGAFGGRLGVFF
jgi:hypothetical protein